MTVQTFLIIFAACSFVTSLFTEAIKKLFPNKKLPTNVLVLIVAIIVGTGISIVYYLAKEIPFTAINICYAVIMGLANWLGATLGYDKVKQTIEQFVKGGSV